MWAYRPGFVLLDERVARLSATTYARTVGIQPPPAVPGAGHFPADIAGFFWEWAYGYGDGREEREMNGNRPTEDQIRLRAYEIYLRRGGQHGWDQDDWFQAEKELKEEAGRKVAGPKPKRPGKGPAGTNPTASVS